jgi:flagellar motility protein MotE (MotC chaperone)
MSNKGGHTHLSPRQEAKFQQKYADERARRSKRREMVEKQQQAEVKVEHTYRTMDEIAARLRELGLEPRRIYPLLTDEKKPEDEVH